MAFLGVLIITVTVGLIGAFFALFFSRNARKFHLLQKVVPGPKQLPIFGNTFELLVPKEDLLPKFHGWLLQFGPRMLYRIGSYWILIIACPKDMERVLTSTTEIKKSIDYDLLIPWLGEGLLTSYGKKWNHRRKMLTPAFHFKILEQFMETFNEQSKVLIDVWKKNIESGQFFDVVPYIARCTLEIICESAMGIKMDAQLQPDTEYIKALNRVKHLQIYRGFRPWLENSFVWNVFSYGREEAKLLKTLHAFTDKVILERKKTFLEKKKNQQEPLQQKLDDDQIDIKKASKNRLALLDLMLEAQHNGKDFDDQAIREETDTFMFGGHDTTAATASFTLFLIGNHPEVQKKLQDELEFVFEGNRERPVTPEDLTKLKYLECCIKESMRLCTPIPMVGRTLQNEFELDEGVILPPETLLMIFPYLLHKNPEVFPNPQNYEPERFLPENVARRHPFAYLPFSAGARNCIGQKFAMMEEKILLANIFRKLHVESRDKLDQLVLVSDMILHSKDGLHIKISKRLP